MITLLSGVVFYFLYSYMANDDYTYVKFWSLLTLLLIYAYFRFQRKVVIFAPLNLFCFYYITIVVVNFYYLGNNFEMTPYLEKGSLRADLVHLFSLSTFYYFIGLLSVIIGYSLIKDPDLKPIKYENYKTINRYALKAVAYTMLVLGALNFMYNVMIYAGGNPLTYLAEIAVRTYQFESSGTTFLYIFYYMGSYCLAFHYLREKKSPGLFFIMVVIGGVLLWASKGRIFSTLTYAVSFFAMFYFANVTSNPDFKNRKYLVFLFLIPFIAISLYVFRLISSLREMGVVDDQNLWAVILELSNTLSFYIIDKGNLPNTAIFIKVLDSWKLDHGFLYGESLFSWLLNILPSSLRPEGYQPSAIIKNLWYSSLTSGNLPPTGVAEMYMNFGAAGPVAGMFVFGILIKLFYVVVVKSRNFWTYLVLIQISLGFIIIYPKGEFDNLNLIFVFLAYFPAIACIVMSLFFQFPFFKKPVTSTEL